MENAKQLKSLVLQKLPKETELSEWHSAILDEACETTIKDYPDLLLSELVQTAICSFLVAQKVAHSVIQAGFRMDSEVTVNYRGKTFVFRDHLYS